MWMAPNLVTLLGFFFIIGNVGLLELYIPDLVGPVGAIYARGWNSS
jgi:ethanolaminephosphotransferase